MSPQPAPRTRRMQNDSVCPSSSRTGTPAEVHPEVLLSVYLSVPSSYSARSLFVAFRALMIRTSVARRSVKATTNKRSLIECPIMISRCSFWECRSSSKITASGSEKTVLASSKPLWCFRLFAAAYATSHSNRSDITHLPMLNSDTRQPHGSQKIADHLNGTEQSLFGLLCAGQHKWQRK